jgi:hypothetical protein
MKIDSKDFRVREGDEVSLQKWPTSMEPVHKSKKQYQKLLNSGATVLLYYLPGENEAMHAGHQTASCQYYRFRGGDQRSR